MSASFSELIAPGGAVPKPAQRLTKLGIDAAEQLAALQLASFSRYYELGMRQLATAATVNDAAALRALASKQGAVLREIGQCLLTDATACIHLGIELILEAMRVAQKEAQAAPRKSQ